MDSEELVYKVEVVLSESNDAGTCEIDQFRKIRYFDDFEEAKQFALSGDVITNDPWLQVKSHRLWVCHLVPDRELHYVQKEKTRQVIDITWEWE